ncbi:unnamed protein product, partial [marine sediment metagenome]
SVVTFQSNEPLTAELNGFTISGGTGTYLSAFDWTAGGGILCYSASPTIKNNKVIENTSENEGGGIACYYSSDQTIEGNTISYNSAGSTLSIGFGGGISVWSDNITIKNNTISDNSAGTNSTFGFGGGFQCASSTTGTIENNTIIGNSAGSSNTLGYGGGIACWDGSSLTIKGNIICDNSSGVLWICWPSIYYAFGGGIFLGDVPSNPPTKLINNTIAYNTVKFGYGGGIFLSFPESQIEITNSIFYKNSDYFGIGGQIAWWSGNPEPILTYCNYQLSSGVAPGAGNINEDPVFVDPSICDYHLQSTSPCIDVGNNNPVILTGLTTDIDGEDRIQNGTVDMGADEGGAPTLVELISFTAAGFRNRVAIEWETASEIDNAGFHIWRSRADNNSAEGEWIRVTEQLIPAKGGPTWGAEYTFVDRAVLPGHTCYYRLEDISYKGISTLHDPVLTRWK